MKRFKIENLPKDVKVKVDLIEWDVDETAGTGEPVINYCWLKEGYSDGVTGSTMLSFETRSELVEYLREDVVAN